LPFKREWYLGFGSEDNLVAIMECVPKGTHYRWKNPDLLYMGKYGMIIIEVDGAVHDRKVSTTEKRNDLYLSNRIKLIVLNLRDIKANGKTLNEALDEKMRRILGQ
jgi:hypothetical protein